MKRSNKLSIFFKTFLWNISEAFSSIKSNKLRVLLTSAIISIGISSLVGILTSIDGIQQSVSSSFSELGSNSFYIRSLRNDRGKESGVIKKNYPIIKYREAKDFISRYDGSGIASISTRVTPIAELKYKSEITNPNVVVDAGDHNYMVTTQKEIISGRNFTQTENKNGNFVTIIGSRIKSTLFKKLTNEDVVCKDMLFATLDPTVRISELRSGFSVIMTDTVGFISDLPTELIASFRSTLEEVLNSDIILHVRDISHPNTDNHSQDVSDILEKIGLDENIPVLEVWNKIDLHSECQKLQQPDISLNKRKIYPVCAASGAGLENLKTGIINVISARYSKDIRNVSVTDGKKRAWLYRNGVVESERLVDENYKMVLRWSEKQRKQFDLL